MDALGVQQEAPNPAELHGSDSTLVPTAAAAADPHPHRSFPSVSARRSASVTSLASSSDGRQTPPLVAPPHLLAPSSSFHSPSPGGGSQNQMSAPSPRNWAALVASGIPPEGPHAMGGSRSRSAAGFSGRPSGLQQTVKKASTHASQPGSVQQQLDHLMPNQVEVRRSECAPYLSAGVPSPPGPLPLTPAHRSPSGLIGGGYGASASMRRAGGHLRHSSSELSVDVPVRERLISDRWDLVVLGELQRQRGWYDMLRLLM